MLKESQLTCGNPEVHTFSSHFLKPADQTGREETAQLEFLDLVTAITQALFWLLEARY